MSRVIDRLAAQAGDCDPAMVRKAETAISDARMSLMLDAPFYGAIALRLVTVANATISQGTAATDGHSLFYNPEWINTLAPKALVGLIAHEVMHIAMKHTLRREGRNPRDWNIACDHAINNDLRDCGYELPDDGFCDRDYRGWSAEDIYPHVERPKREVTPQPVCGGAGVPEPGDDGEPKVAVPVQSDEDAESEKLPAGAVLDSPDPVADEAALDGIIIEATMCAKAAGNMPAHLGKLVNSLTRAKVNFADLLAEFITRHTDSDYSMAQANRRYLQAGVYLPALRTQDAAPEIAFFIDNSGSIDTDQLSLAVNALEDCIQQVQPERVHVIACDTEVNLRATFERGEPIKIDVHHGGGTDFNPPFAQLEREGIEPACALYFTDGCGSWPEKEPPYPVLWMMTGGYHATPPFGQVIQVDQVRPRP